MSNLRGLNDSVIDRSGGVYFTEPYGSDVLNPNGRGFYLAPEGQQQKGKTLTILMDQVAFPNGITLSPGEDVLYVSDYKKIASCTFRFLRPER